MSRLDSFTSGLVSCSGTSVLSSHFFSRDAKTWTFLPHAIQPYGHTVRYDDGTQHMFVTIERPSVRQRESNPQSCVHAARPTACEALVHAANPRGALLAGARPAGLIDRLSRPTGLL